MDDLQKRESEELQKSIESLWFEPAKGVKVDGLPEGYDSDELKVYTYGYGETEVRVYRDSIWVFYTVTGAKYRFDKKDSKEAFGFAKSRADRSRFFR